MLPIASFILGLIGFLIDTRAGTPYVFQCIGVWAGYVLWVRARLSAIKTKELTFDALSALWILFITWCTVWFSGAPKFGLENPYEMTSDLRFALWSLASLPVSIVVIYLHWLAAKSSSTKTKEVVLPPPPKPAVAKKEEPRVCCWTCTQFEVSGWLDRTKGYCRRHQRKTFADLVCENYEPKGQ